MAEQHPLLQELVEEEQIIALSRRVEELKQVDVYQLHFPVEEELQREALRWANSIFSAAGLIDSRPEPKRYNERFVLTHPDGHRIRAYYGSGYMEYTDLRRIFTGETEVSSIRESDSIVQRFVSMHSLWPPDSVGQIQAEGMRFVKSQGGASEGRFSKIVTNNVIVSYKRLTSGLQWIGPGSKITAVIEGTDVIGFNRHWRKIIPKQFKVTLLPVKEALKRTIDRLSSSLDGKTMHKGDIELTKVDFGYYATGRRKLQRFLQPAYIFTYEPKSNFSTAAIVDVQLAHTESFENILEEPVAEVHKERPDPEMFRKK